MKFTEKDRQVYACPYTMRAYDPLAVRRALQQATGGKFSLLCAEKTEAARTQLVLAARAAFSLPPLSADGQSGVLEATVWETLCAFTAWLAGKEPRAQSTAGSAPSTDSPAALPTTITSC